MKFRGGGGRPLLSRCPLVCQKTADEKIADHPPALQSWLPATFSCLRSAADTPQQLAFYFLQWNPVADRQCECVRRGNLH
jgi:hypothetical protein